MQINTAIILYIIKIRIHDPYERLFKQEFPGKETMLVYIKTVLCKVLQKFDDNFQLFCRNLKNNPLNDL